MRAGVAERPVYRFESKGAVMPAGSFTADIAENRERARPKRSTPTTAEEHADNIVDLLSA